MRTDRHVRRRVRQPARYDKLAWLVQLAQGHSNPYDWLLAISGPSYLLAVVFFRWRG